VRGKRGNLAASAIVYPLVRIADVIANLGRPGQIRKVFAGFQKYLYEEEKLPATECE